MTTSFGVLVSLQTLKLPLLDLGLSLDHLLGEVTQLRGAHALAYLLNHLSPALLVKIEALLHPVERLLKHGDLLLRDVVL